jgi:hypothetical protein
VNRSTRDLAADIEQIATFAGTNLASTVANLESNFAQLTKQEVLQQLTAFSINDELVEAARSVKRAAGQINVVIHALGILTCLPLILGEGEIVEALSLGAGSTENQRFDLETNRRVAEFTFIDWRGNDNTRLQKIFKDFYRLAEFKTDKAKELWLTESAHALKYLKSDTSIRSATHKHRNVWDSLRERYPSLETVNDYYRLHSEDVALREFTATVWNPLPRD